MADFPVRTGVPLGSYAGRIDADAAIAYALATNDPNAIYLRGEAIPPLFTVSLIQPAFADVDFRATADHLAHPEWAEAPGAGVVRNAHGGVHGKHDVTFYAPVEPEMHVRWDVSTHSAHQTSAGVLVTQRIVVTDDDGRPLIEHLWSSMRLGGVIDPDLGPELPDHTFPTSARERPIGSHTFDVSLDQPFRYAGASGDRVLHSIDDEAARAEGFPRKILQGLGTFAMCSGAVVALGASGDPSGLRRIAARFSSPMLPKQQLLVELFDAGRTETGGRVVVFEATAGGVTVIKHGRAEFAP